MTFGIIGATGFIGRAVTQAAIASGHTVVGYSRSSQATGDGIAEWRASSGDFDFEGIDVVVNLSGYPIDCRWTAARKEKFYESRVGVTERVVAALASMPEEKRPKVFLAGSAVGIYGDGGENDLPEDAPHGNCYLTELSQQWEAANAPAVELGVRVCSMRIGFVLGRGGAAYERLEKVFRLGLGGKLGSGQQWMPWIHIKDIAKAFVFAAENEAIDGPINLAAPESVRNVELTKALGKALRRPTIFFVPGFLLKLVLGGFGKFLLTGQKVVPAKLVEHGFSFEYGNLDKAFAQLTN